uniref:Uncharacterized protein n=1 Tax=Mus spicilegus TaxID=10103 RepID=A0A8C6G6Y7_MUSSI
AEQPLPRPDALTLQGLEDRLRHLGAAAARGVGAGLRKHCENRGGVGAARGRPGADAEAPAPETACPAVRPETQSPSSSNSTQTYVRRSYIASQRGHRPQFCNTHPMIAAHSLLQGCNTNPPHRDCLLRGHPTPCNCVTLIGKQPSRRIPISGLNSSVYVRFPQCSS